MRPVVMSIAGSDPSGGAGIQADLKTFHAHGVYGCAVPTLLTVQNTLGVKSVHRLSGELIEAQITAVLEDLPMAAIKTGALGTADAVAAVAKCLRGRGIPLVIDPVMLSKNGSALLDAAGVDALRATLLPMATLVTPNLDEARTMLAEGATLDMAGLAKAWLALGARAVLIKGGHSDGAPTDWLFADGTAHALTGTRVDTSHTHGLGCTLSAAIAARLALGEPLLSACQGAKSWVAAALASAPGLGHGAGPIDHFVKP
jgi:hydroxymethylpyrimidine/phosphomethylpyrimidine kinase